MGTVIAASLGGLVALGVTLVVAGLLRRQRPAGEGARHGGGLGRAWAASSPRARWWVVGSLAAGVVTSVLTGWLMAAVLVPAALLGVPFLLSAPPLREVELLAALDRWVRLLGPSISTGKSIRDAIMSTRHQVPGLLAEPVARVVARMDQGWTTKDALLAMADDVASADGDAVLAALGIAASRGGVGTRVTLAALADNTQDRLQVLREISAERAKPRAVVRQVTLITLTILGGALLLGGSFFEPYKTPLGQLLALGLALVYVGSLALLRRRTTPVPAGRFLRAEP